MEYMFKNYVEGLVLCGIRFRKYGVELLLRFYLIL